LCNTWYVHILSFVSQSRSLYMVAMKKSLSLPGIESQSSSISASYCIAWAIPKSAASLWNFNTSSPSRGHSKSACFGLFVQPVTRDVLLFALCVYKFYLSVSLDTAGQILPLLVSWQKRRETGNVSDAPGFIALFQQPPQTNLYSKQMPQIGYLQVDSKGFWRWCVTLGITVWGGGGFIGMAQSV
jgi:hypothetical protein